MTPKLVPVPPGNLNETRHIWWPYLLLISERDRCDPNIKEQMLRRTEVQAFIVWDDDAKAVIAFLGVQFLLRGSDRMGQIIWLTGENRAAWVHLFTELEIYLREHQGCKTMRAFARKGWSKHLLASGYRETHRVFDKELS